MPPSYTDAPFRRRTERERCNRIVTKGAVPEAKSGGLTTFAAEQIHAADMARAGPPPARPRSAPSSGEDLDRLGEGDELATVTLVGALHCRFGLLPGPYHLRPEAGNLNL